MNVRVKNLSSPRTGREVANQFVINAHGVEYFQSYSTTIAKRNKKGEIILDRDFWDYSNTTLKYLGQWLGHYSKETRERIKSGQYKLAKLNPENHQP